MVIIWVVVALFCLPIDGFASILKNIEASQIDYDTKKIRLSGAVYIVHEFGELRCEKGVLLFEEAQSTKLSPSRILLEGDVHITLQDGATIASDEADIDCKSLEAVFVCIPPKKVSYIMKIVEDAKTVPVKATSQALRVLMKKSDGPKSEYVIADLQGEGAVNIEYQKIEPEEKQI